MTVEYPVSTLARRRFVQGVAAAGAFAALQAGRSALAAGAQQVLSGTDIQLELGQMPINITGRAMTFGYIIAEELIGG